MNAVLVGGAALVGLASAAMAEVTWVPDQAHTQVKFTVTYMAISEVSGTFDAYDFTLVQPGTDFQNARIQATIKTASVNTGNDRRDNHLRSDDFFNATQYPEITFASNAFEKIGDSAYTITGDLTIRDVTQPVVLQAVYRGMVVDPRGNIKAGFQATGTINRQDFGVRWNKALDTGGVVVSDEVTILLDVILKQVKRDSL